MKRMILVLAVACTACVQTNVTPLNPAIRYEGICVDAVQLFTTPERVSGEYAEVALLNSSGSSSATNEQQMIASMRVKAASIGATGIILSGIAEPSAGAKVAGEFLGTGSERKGRAIAIRRAADSAAVNAACSREFADSTGARWRVAEFQDGEMPRLRFRDGGGTTRVYAQRPVGWRTFEERRLRDLLRRARPVTRAGE